MAPHVVHFTFGSLALCWANGVIDDWIELNADTQICIICPIDPLNTLFINDIHTAVVVVVVYAETYPINKYENCYKGISDEMLYNRPLPST